MKSTTAIPMSTASSAGGILALEQATRPRPVLTKRDFVRRYALGEFGNHSPTWNNYKEWWEDWGDDGWEFRKYHIRNRVAGGPTHYNIEADDLRRAWDGLLAAGVSPASLYISEMCPTEKTLFQGEVRQSEHYLDLRYTTVARPMREALAERQHHTSGIIAVALLRHYLCPKSFDWLTFLLEAYPDHIIEFSTFSVNWGTLPGYNTVTWEVRRY